MPDKRAFDTKVTVEIPKYYHTKVPMEDKLKVINRQLARLCFRVQPLPDPPPLKWSDLRYAFDIKEDCNGKEAIQA